MKENFDKSFELVIGHEGGFTKDRKDRGNWTTGVIGKGSLKGTKFGVSAMAYPDLDIENLTLDQAKDIYLGDYWLRVNADALPSGLDYLAFDMAVNHGVKKSAMLIQEAVGAVPDGAIGPRTLERIAKTDLPSILREVAARRMVFYAGIKTFKDYGLGWSRRTMDSLATALGWTLMDQSKEDKSFIETWFRRV